MASLASNLACQDFPISWRDDMGLVVGFEDKDSARIRDKVRSYDSVC